MLELDKKTKVVFVNTDQYFDLEKLAKKEPDLLNELMEKYPLKNDTVFMVKYHKAVWDTVDEVVEVATPVESTPEEQPVEEPTVEEPKVENECSEDFEPLYKSGEHITIKYDYDRIVEKITILEAIPVKDENNKVTSYDYKYLVSGGGICVKSEDFLVDSEVVEE